MKQRSSKLAKLERNRYSVFHKGTSCYLCNSTYQLTWHEIFEGVNRQNSMRYGFCLRMCLSCHRRITNDNEFILYWKQTAQFYFEHHYGTRDDFIKVFHRNYL